MRGTTRVDEVECNNRTFLSMALRVSGNFDRIDLNSNRARVSYRYFIFFFLLNTKKQNIIYTVNSNTKTDWDRICFRVLFERHMILLNLAALCQLYFINPKLIAIVTFHIFFFFCCAVDFTVKELLSANEYFIGWFVFRNFKFSWQCRKKREYIELVSFQDRPLYVFKG